MKSSFALPMALVVCGLCAADVASAKKAPVDKFETDCFAVNLPKGRFTMFRRDKLDKAKPYLGAWAYTNQDGTIRLYVRCTTPRVKTIQDAVKGSMRHLLKRVRNWKEVEKPTFEKDEKGHPVASLIGQGEMPILDKKTGKIHLQTQLVARTLMLYLGRKLQVSITTIIAHARAKELEPLMTLVGDSFDVSDAKEMKQMEEKAAKEAKHAAWLKAQPLPKPARKPAAAKPAGKPAPAAKKGGAK